MKTGTTYPDDYNPGYDAGFDPGINYAAFALDCIPEIIFLLGVAGYFIAKRLGYGE